MIPLGTDRPLARTTVVTLVLIGLNVALYLIGALRRGPVDPDEARAFGAAFAAADPLAEALKLSRGAVGGKAWTLVTYAFLHADFWHIFGNMLVLWVFGPNVEDRLGKIGFLVFYVLAAAISGGAYIAFSPYPVIGASGAVAAVTGAYAVLFPRTTIKCLVFIVFIGVFNIPALWFIAIAVARDLLGIGSGGRVAYQAHLAGYAFGSTVAFILLATKILPREPYDLFQIFRQKRRRAELRAAVEESTRASRAKPSPIRDGPAVVSAVPEEALQLRARVNAAITAGDLTAAATLYRELCETYPAHPPVLVLSRQNMMLLANHLFSAGEHAQASRVYERFMAGYPTDAELPHVKLMLGLIGVRYLNKPAEARTLLNDAAARLTDEQHAELARSLLAEIDAPRV
jgi:membrane associated rhomboid family serine protease